MPAPRTLTRTLTRTANTETAATFVDDHPTRGTGKVVDVVKLDGAPTSVSIDAVELPKKLEDSTNPNGDTVREYVETIAGHTYHVALVGDGDAMIATMLST